MSAYQVVFDTETTGLSPTMGHKILEIGCVKLKNFLPMRDPVGEFHCFINPHRSIPMEATAIHGITAQMVTDKPLFKDIAQDFLDFIADCDLVAHNASFDMAFINAELGESGYSPIASKRVIDTLTIAKRQYPKAMVSLDALCRRFGIDLSVRAGGHGALVDARLLSKVYLELMGGEQYSIAMEHGDAAPMASSSADTAPVLKVFRAPRVFDTAEDTLLHDTFLKQIPNALWRKL